jgi:hypothetical protein
MVYANPKISNYSIPENSPSDVVIQSYQNGKEVSSYTSGDIVKSAQQLWSNHFSKAGEHPVFISVNLETPLGLASFIANNANCQKVYIPATFNMSKILHSLKTQETRVVVCDEELYTLEPPQNKKAELAEQTTSVKKVVVASNKKVSASPLFSAGDVSSLDPYRL